MTRDRGQLPDFPGRDAKALITAHPSAILRVPDPDAKAKAFDALVVDLAAAAEGTRRR